MDFNEKCTWKFCIGKYIIVFKICAVKWSMKQWEIIISVVPLFNVAWIRCSIVSSTSTTLKGDLVVTLRNQMFVQEKNSSICIKLCTISTIVLQLWNVSPPLITHNSPRYLATNNCACSLKIQTFFLLSLFCPKHWVRVNW